MGGDVPPLAPRETPPQVLERSTRRTDHGSRLAGANSMRLPLGGVMQQLPYNTASTNPHGESLSSAGSTKNATPHLGKYPYIEQITI